MDEMGERMAGPGMLGSAEVGGFVLLGARRARADAAEGGQAKEGFAEVYVVSA